MSLQGVYNMPSGLPFLHSLAKGIKQNFGQDLSRALILLPTRRAVRTITDIFLDMARHDASGVTLLPRLNTLADIDPNEPPFEPSDVAGLVPPAIDATQRRFEMARVIEQFYRRASDLPLDAASALSLADPLLTILDDAAAEETRIADLSELADIQAFAAQHFQYQAELYKIIQTYWPRRLKEIEALEPKARQVRVLDTLTQQWRDNRPDYPIIVAGSTGTLGATARLMACVAELPKGVVVLPGLNKSTDKVWNAVNEQHPQNALRNLLNIMRVNRGDVRTWPYIHETEATQNRDLKARRQLLSESLVPVDNTSDWLGRIKTIRENFPHSDPFIEGMKGLSVIEAANDEDEALSIALILRETLEKPNRTAALVTPDQALARRVKARLRRWDIDVDLSQGEPLEETPIGGFLSAIIDLADDPDDPVALSVLFNHPLLHLGEDYGVARIHWQVLEKRIFRGVRPSAQDIMKRDKYDLIPRVNTALAPLLELEGLHKSEIWAKALWLSALNLTEDGQENNSIWSGEGGKEAQSVLRSLINFGDNLPTIDSRGLSRLLGVLMRGKVVRKPFGTHPRLSILGPLEARMLNADIVILGGLNEGVWPTTPRLEPFLSRSMRKAVGLSLPEKRFGLSAHDFAELASNPNVILTRAKRSGGSPMVASRWLWRLSTLLEGALGEDEAAGVMYDVPHYLDWAEQLDATTEITPAAPPEPRPDPSQRWQFARGRSISITQVKIWIRDPYSIFAKHSLGLKSLDPLDAELDAGRFGTAIHDGLEAFLRAHETKAADQASHQLIAFLQASFKEAGYAPEDISKEQSRFTRISAQFIAWLKIRRDEGFDVEGIEETADYRIEALNFTLRGKADLIERRPDGYGVVDYKTGVPATAKVVAAGFDPQLPLTAWLLAQGGFSNLPKGQTVALGYVRIKGSNDDFEHSQLTPPHARNGLSAEDYAEQAHATLRELILTYDKKETAYYSQPRIQYTHDFGEFDDLARRGEWASLGRESSQ
jgi:ATP-dependent helicase/nuclease subunit B